MKFCHHCAAPIEQQIPAGDDRQRYYCGRCDVVFYQNPNNIVGTLTSHEDRVLLCRRAIEPRRGYWTLPAGFMENGESSLYGALRETREEAGAEPVADPDSLYVLYNLPHINQVYLFFRARLERPEFASGIESLETALFTETDVPWNDIAFPVVRKTLQLWFEDRRQGHFPVRMFDVQYGQDRQIDMRLISRS